MKIYKEGDTLNAICENCKSMVKATCKIRDVPFSDTKDIVENILVGCCNNCDNVILSFPQSTPQIKSRLNELKKG